MAAIGRSPSSPRRLYATFQSPLHPTPTNRGGGGGGGGGGDWLVLAGGGDLSPVIVFRWAARNRLRFHRPVGNNSNNDRHYHPVFIDININININIYIYIYKIS